MEVPATTPTQQLAAAEAARKDGDQNPKVDPVDKVAELERQLALAKKERQDTAKPTPHPVNPGTTNPNPPLETGPTPTLHPPKDGTK